jgi:hypothetical protein
LPLPSAATLAATLAPALALAPPLPPPLPVTAPLTLAVELTVILALADAGDILDRVANPLAQLTAPCIMYSTAAKAVVTRAWPTCALWCSG